MPAAMSSSGIQADFLPPAPFALCWPAVPRTAGLAVARAVVARRSAVLCRRLVQSLCWPPLPAAVRLCTRCTASFVTGLFGAGRWAAWRWGKGVLCFVISFSRWLCRRSRRYAHCPRAGRRRYSANRKDQGRRCASVLLKIAINGQCIDSDGGGHRELCILLAPAHAWAACTA